MNNGLEPELSDAQLLAYLDGEADDAVAVHLAGCATCRERMQSHAAWQRDLLAMMYRAECPPPDQIGEYHLGLLSKDEDAFITRHLALCPHCTGELEQFRTFLSDLAPETERSTVEHVKILIASLLPRNWNNNAFPVLATRGEQEEPLVYQADSVQVVIEVQEEVDHTGRQDLLGLVLGMEAATTIQVHLWRDTQLLATTSVDEIGNFAFAGLERGDYELILSGPDMELHIQSLQLT